MFEFNIIIFYNFNLLQNMLFFLWITVSCSHTRAHELYADSVYNKYSLIAVQCSTWSNFKDGECKNNTRIPLGHDATPRYKYLKMN